MSEFRPRVAIVDYEMGNLFSVKHACEHVGLDARITNSRRDILSASAVILPGVGAFGDAMESLRRLDLIQPLRDVAGSQVPLLGVCLGMQLLMSQSQEHGTHEGLGLVEGEVVRLEERIGAGRRLKVPHVGWNLVQVERDVTNRPEGSGSVWRESLLEGLTPGVFMYFVHSFYCRPLHPDAALAQTRYGDLEFCSAIRSGNIFGVQFHPERSGSSGLRIYQNLAKLVNHMVSEGETDGRKAGSQVRVT